MIIKDNNLRRGEEKNGRSNASGMRFFRKIQISNPKGKEKNDEDCMSNGTIRRLDRSDGGEGAGKQGADEGKVNEGFELIERIDENQTEKSAMEGQKVVKTSTDATETHEVQRKTERGGRQLGGKAKEGLDNPNLIHWVTLALVGVATWSIVYFLAGAHFLPGSQLFSLIALFALAHVGGALIEPIGLPPLLGMLLVGLLLRNVDFVRLEGAYVEVAAFLRELALCIILIRAGLGLDPKAVKSLRFVILRLAAIPGMAEALISMTVSHFLLGFPWLWGLLLGAILAAVSPAVVIPSLFALQEKGYGTGKGVPTLVVAAASLDDILAITVFGVVLGLIYSTGKSITMQIVQGPVGIAVGIAFGITWGFVARFVPHRNDGQVVLLRVLVIIGGGLGCIVGSRALGCQGAGPLGCITAAFVACLGWRKEDYADGRNPVADVFRVIWSIFQPILFGLIGAEVNVSVLDESVIGNGFVALICSLLGRIIVTVLVAFGADFNWKERTFIAWAWFPKATVQAALGPLALDLARRSGSEEDITHARKILVIAVLAILLTAPLGAILIRILGPRLLAKETGKRSGEQRKLDEVSLESRDDEKDKT